MTPAPRRQRARIAPPLCKRPARAQRGLALPTVLALVLLAGMASLLVARQLWLQERLLRVQDERLRQQQLAQGVLALALRDITAAPTLPDGTPNWRQRMGDAQQSHAFFPTTLAEHAVLRQRLGAAGCREGICIAPASAPGTPIARRTVQEWLALTAQALPVAASELPETNARAHYWVEVFIDQGDLLRPNDAPRFHYRITALVQGTSSGSRVAWQGLWRRTLAGDAAGHWSSLHPLAP